MASDFVQAVVRRPGRVPYIVLHNDDQMADLRRFCCGGYTIYKTVIGVDKTFNLSDLHVTVTVYKNLSLLSRRSGDHPIFMGPVFLHGNSDQETYKHFFHHLKMQLDTGDCMPNPVFGSDEEKAIRCAIKNSFPESQIMCCSRHLSKNLNALLSDKVGLSKKERKEIKKVLFAKDGGMNAARNAHEGEDIINDIADKYDSNTKKYILKIKEHLVSNLALSLRRDLDSQYTWTNNNCESYNHVLKQVVDWKSLHLLKLRQFSLPKRGARSLVLGSFVCHLSTPNLLYLEKSGNQCQLKAVANATENFSKPKCPLTPMCCRAQTAQVPPISQLQEEKKTSQRKRKQTAKTTTPRKRSRHTVE